MSLISRISLTGPPAEDPEDFLGSSLGVVFPDDVTNQHGDADHGLSYSSPHLPKPLLISLAEPTAEEDRRLFSHYLWNSSLLLAEFLEAGTLKLSGDEAPQMRGSGLPFEKFNVTGLSTIELGAGTALPSIMAALLGAGKVVITDYPSPVVLDTLRDNVARNVELSFSPLKSVSPVIVEGHEWGNLSTALAEGNKHAFDRVFVCDCLWMPWQHTNLHKSISWFLKDTPEARCWVVAGFHSGREKMREFFGADALAKEGLEVEHIYEKECDGKEREWAWDRGYEEIGIRKRWLVSASLKRLGRGSGER